MAAYFENGSPAMQQLTAIVDRLEQMVDHAMTRAERRAERRAMQAQIAVRVWAQFAATHEVKKQISARGERVGDYSHRDLVLRAEALLKERPEFITQAWERAKVEFAQA